MPLNNFTADCLTSALNPSPETKKTLHWLEDLKKRRSFVITPIEFSQLNQWSFEEGSGDLVHQSGKFFRVLGLEQKTVVNGQQLIWQQPIVEQAEIGILGFITQLQNGILKFLMQAKFEPGTVNRLQLASTVQATHSNYSQVHQGAKPPYIEYFMDLSKVKVLYDSLQSEHGCRFLGKRNRNLIIQVDDDIPLKEEFRWVSLREINEFATIPNLLNMPARSVLAAINYEEKEILGLSAYGKKVLKSFTEDKNFEVPLDQIKKWVYEQRAAHEVTVKKIGLSQLKDWIKTDSSLSPKAGTPAFEAKSFSIGAVNVEAKMREVSSWGQPLVWCDRGPWISGLITQVRNGVLHGLVQNLFEPGLPEKSELGPTLSYRQPEPSLQNSNPLDFKNTFEKAPASQVRYDSVQSSEGGRFYFEQNRLMILELPADVKMKPPDRYQWMTLSQLRRLLNEYGWVNIELRELMACFSLTSGAQ